MTPARPFCTQGFLHSSEMDFEKDGPGGFLPSRKNTHLFRHSKFRTQDFSHSKADLNISRPENAKRERKKRTRQQEMIMLTWWQCNKWERRKTSPTCSARAGSDEKVGDLKSDASKTVRTLETWGLETCSVGRVQIGSRVTRVTMKKRADLRDI